MYSIGSVKENPDTEKRISITPETIKKFVSLKFSVFLEKNYGDNLGISNETFQKEGAVLLNSTEEVFKKSNLILKVNCPIEQEINLIKDNSILIGQFDPVLNSNSIKELIKKKITLGNKKFYG